MKAFTIVDMADEGIPDKTGKLSGSAGESCG